MKIALINPPFLFHHSRVPGPSKCLGLRSLSAVLKDQGHSVSLIDAFSEGLTNIKPYVNGFIFGLKPEQIITMVPGDTELIGIGVPFSQLAPIAHDLITLLRNRFPSARIVMGGVYPSSQPRLALTSQADIIVIGEGEMAITDIAMGKDPGVITGAYTKSDLKGSTMFRHADMVSRLDDLPFSDYDFPGIDQYFISNRCPGQGNTASIITSRGCPYACEFCSIHSIYGSKWRARSSKNVLDEIRLLNDRFGVKRIEFEDDNLTLNQNRAAEIFEGLIHMNEKGADIHWCTPNGIRIDTLDEEIIHLMKLSGCESITFGIEHGDPEMLRIMNKKMDLDVAFRTIEQCVRQGIPSIMFFIMVGYPGETRKRFEQSRKYIKRIKSLSANISILPSIVQPYPATKLLERCRSYGYINDENIDNFLIRRDVMSAADMVSITTPEFDAQEVLHRQYLLFAMNGPRWKQILKRIIPRQLIYIIYRLRKLRPPVEYKQKKNKRQSKVAKSTVKSKYRDGGLVTHSTYDDVTIVLPTLNEEKNICNVLSDVFTHCAGSSIIVADEGSRDRTKEIVLSQKYNKLVFLDRSKEDIHGLTISILDAMFRAKTKYVIVMDADGQHPANKVNEMLGLMLSGSKLVVASRVGHDGSWPFKRKIMSYAAGAIGKIALLARGKNYMTYDIMSGFFGCDTDFLKDHIPSGDKGKYFRLKGYKILFDLLKIMPSDVAVEEVSYIFESRKAEMSKMNMKVMIEYLKACFL